MATTTRSSRMRIRALSAKLARNSTLKTYAGFPHGMPTSNVETINADLLAFIRG